MPPPTPPPPPSLRPSPKDVPTTYDPIDGFSIHGRIRRGPTVVGEVASARRAGFLRVPTARLKKSKKTKRGGDLEALPGGARPTPLDTHLRGHTLLQALPNSLALPASYTRPHTAPGLMLYRMNIMNEHGVGSTYVFVWWWICMCVVVERDVLCARMC